MYYEFLLREKYIGRCAHVTAIYIRGKKINFGKNYIKMVFEKFCIYCVHCKIVEISAIYFLTND